VAVYALKHPDGRLLWPLAVLELTPRILARLHTTLTLKDRP
jgi:hypothetical protein